MNNNIICHSGFDPESMQYNGHLVCHPRIPNASEECLGSMQSVYSQGGYIAVTSVLLISLLLITITSALSMTNYFSRYNILENEFKERSSSLAEACVYYAIGQLAIDINYIVTASDHDKNLGLYECDFVSKQNNFPIFGQTTIITQGKYPENQTNASYTNLKVVINSSTFRIVSWEESPN